MHIPQDHEKAMHGKAIYQRSFLPYLNVQIIYYDIRMAFYEE